MSEAAPMGLGEALEIFFRTPAQYQQSPEYRGVVTVVFAALKQQAQSVSRGKRIDADDLAGDVLVKLCQRRNGESVAFVNRGENHAKAYLRKALVWRMKDVVRREKKSTATSANRCRRRGRSAGYGDYASRDLGESRYVGAIGEQENFCRCVERIRCGFQHKEPRTKRAC